MSDRIYRLAKRYAVAQDTDGMRRLFEALCASIQPVRYFRIIEMLALWMLPSAELAGVLNEDGEPSRGRTA